MGIVTERLDAPPGPPVDEVVEPSTGVRLRLALSLAALGLLLVLGIVLGDSRSWSGSDAGGKVATVKAMADSGTWRADVGYWAEASDPAGDYHPLVYTERRAGRWVQVTGLPFVLLGVPLWHLAGPAGLLVVPVGGVLLAAYAARRLALTLGDPTGWTAFWLVGAVAPVAFYAADVWEHAPATGCALLAVALALERACPRRALAIGLLLGTAVVLRREMAIYGTALVLAVVVVPGTRSMWGRGRGRLAGVVVAGAGAVLAGNWLVERVVLGDGLSGVRTASNVADAGSEAGQRVVDAAVTTVGLFALERGGALLLGAVLAVALLLVALAAVRPARRSFLTKVGAAVAIGLYAGRFGTGLGFVPGLLPAAPLAAAGLMSLRRPAERVVAMTALLPLPLIWTFAWRGQMTPQWGGRYVLLTSTLLLVAGSVAVGRVGWRRPAAALLAILTVLVGGAGAAWHAESSKAVAALVSDIEATPDDVVIVSAWDHLGREAGAWYGDHRWLRAHGPASVVGAVLVARAEGASRVDLVETDDAPPADLGPSARLLGTRRVALLGLVVTIRSFVLE